MTYRKDTDMIILKHDPYTEQTVELLSSPVVNVEQDSEDCYTVYLSPVEGQVYYLVLTKQDFENVMRPNKVF